VPTCRAEILSFHAAPHFLSIKYIGSFLLHKKHSHFARKIYSKGFTSKCCLGKMRRGKIGRWVFLTLFSWDSNPENWCGGGHEVQDPIILTYGWRYSIWAMNGAARRSAKWARGSREAALPDTVLRGFHLPIPRCAAL
jgi:hypothetical protein